MVEERERKEGKRQRWVGGPTPEKKIDDTKAARPRDGRSVPDGVTVQPRCQIGHGWHNLHADGSGHRCLFPLMTSLLTQAQPPTRTYKVPESVLVVIHTAALDVLLIRRADATDFWQSVTGSKDTPDELLAQTAAREVEEETGIDCAPGSLLSAGLVDWDLRNVYEIYPQWRHRYDPAVSYNTESLFALEVPPGIVVRLNPREHGAHVWLPWREAADRCFSPSNAEAILLLPRLCAKASQDP